MPNKTTYLKDYQPPVFIVNSVALDFDLYDDHALVVNCMQLTRQHPGALSLYGEELELISIDVNDTPLQKNAYQLQDGCLIIPACSDELTLKIITRIRPQDNTKLSGLFRSNQLFCTQCEAEGFRRISFFPDRPDVLTTYTTRICADRKKYPVLLSNGNLMDSGELPNQRHWALWQDPFKKPSYLFALVAGDLACVKDEFTTCSGKIVQLHIYVEPGNEDKCAHAMASLKKAMRWDEEIYGREYDLSIFMIVAVSDFNMGAMENKGLNIFNSKYILARPDTATDSDFENIENVVGHEYFHNWTGNRVTCRDWFQLSLKEGLTVFRDQDFSGDMNSRSVSRISDVKVLRNVQFPEDASSMAHPVRPMSYQEINNFYTATVYNKGAEVIRMQHTLLGSAGFRRGMDLYFQRYDGQAVTIDDFVASMETANEVDFTQFKRWYSQAGTPEIQVTSDYHDHCLTLTMTQSCPPTPECQDKKPFHIPIRIALFDANGQRLPLEQDVLELREAQQTFHFSDLPEKPILSLLRDFSAPVKLNHVTSQEEKLALLRFETDGVAKWDAAQCLALDCITSYLDTPKASWQIPSPLLEAYHHVLEDESLDCSLRAYLLTPPDFEEVTSNLTTVDVDSVDAARDFFRIELGKHLFKPLESTYNTLWKEEDHSMNPQAFGRRQLRNSCLWFLMKADEDRLLKQCQQQYRDAKTMTDQIASLALLANCSNSPIREAALTSFYQQWGGNDLVLDKWFTVQAMSERPNTLEAVKTLLKHPAFNIKNPNKVRALIGAFCQGNPRYFHAANGSGYQFLGDMLIQLDKINPQIGARLATPFTRLRRYNAERQALMKEQLTRLSSLTLSRDLREIIEKSLG